VPTSPSDNVGALRLTDFPLVGALGEGYGVDDQTHTFLCNFATAAATADGGVPDAAISRPRTSCTDKLSDKNLDEIQMVQFPDPSAVRSESWSIEWEGLV